MAGPGQPPYTLVTPTWQTSRSPEAEAQERRLRKEHWDRWQEVKAAEPVIRARLERIRGEWLPSIEQALAEADAALERARAQYVLNRIVGPGGGLLADAQGQPMVTTHEDEEARDPGVATALARRQELVVGRAQLWSQQEQHERWLSDLASGPPPKPED